MKRVDIKEPSGVAMVVVKDDVDDALFNVWSKLQDDLLNTILIDEIKKKQVRGRV
jgi:hypothetical protein